MGWKCVIKAYLQCYLSDYFLRDLEGEMLCDTLARKLKISAMRLLLKAKFLALST